MKRLLWTILLFGGLTLSAQDREPMRFDKTVHDFGDVSVTDGPLSCSFVLTNTGQEPISIFDVVSSCGCTDVNYTRELIKPGESGVISATYKNEDGPLPFDKTLTVYVSGRKRPVVLRLRGVVHDKKKTLSELYGAQKLGAFGLKTRSYTAPSLKQGLSVSEKAQVANLGRQPLHLQFADVHPQLSVQVTPNPIPAGETATLLFTIQASPGLYGYQVYRATPVLNGKKAEAPLEISTWTQDNFALWTKEERDRGALPVFDNSTFNAGMVSRGQVVEAVFPCLNKGKSSLQIYQAYSDGPVTFEPLPSLAAGERGELRLRLDTRTLPQGDNVLMVRLTTNSPIRPFVSLFVALELR